MVYLLLLVPLCSEICKNQQCDNNDKEINKGFIDERPIDKGINDKLGYKEYAASVVEKLSKSNIENSFAIGINSQWGTGKTTFMNLIKQEIKSGESKNKYLIMDFNPWNFEGTQQLKYNFFESLGQVISKEAVLTPHSFKNYASKVSGLSLGVLMDTINQILPKTDKSIEELKKTVEEITKQLNKKIIVFIDDLDRCDYEEILEVLKIIRNTGDFPNVIYVCAYDKIYVDEALKSISEKTYKTYLEKIFS